MNYRTVHTSRTLKLQWPAAYYSSLYRQLAFVQLIRSIWCFELKVEAELRRVDWER